MHACSVSLGMSTIVAGDGEMRRVDASSDSLWRRRKQRSRVYTFLKTEKPETREVELMAEDTTVEAFVFEGYTYGRAEGMLWYTNNPAFLAAPPAPTLKLVERLPPGKAAVHGADAEEGEGHSFAFPPPWGGAGAVEPVAAVRSSPAQTFPGSREQKGRARSGILSQVPTTKHERRSSAPSPSQAPPPRKRHDHVLSPASLAEASSAMVTSPQGRVSSLVGEWEQRTSPGPSPTSLAPPKPSGQRVAELRESFSQSASSGEWYMLVLCVVVVVYVCSHIRVCVCVCWTRAFVCVRRRVCAQCGIESHSPSCEFCLLMHSVLAYAFVRFR
jgi:hypothetical protein